MKPELVKSEVDEVSECAAPASTGGVPIGSGNAGSWSSGAGGTGIMAALVTVLIS